MSPEAAWTILSITGVAGAVRVAIWLSDRRDRSRAEELVKKEADDRRDYERRAFEDASEAGCIIIEGSEYGGYPKITGYIRITTEKQLAGAIIFTKRVIELEAVHREAGNFHRADWLHMTSEWLFDMFDRYEKYIKPENVKKREDEARKVEEGRDTERVWREARRASVIEKWLSGPNIETPSAATTEDHDESALDAFMRTHGGRQ